MLKLVFISIAALILFPCVSLAQGPDPQEVLKELNLARTNPKAYAGFLEKRRPLYKAKKIRLERGVYLMTKEGTAALDEAVKFLKKAKPAGPLKLSEELSRAADDLVVAQGPLGGTGHTAEGAGPEDRIDKYGQWLNTIGENISYGPDEARDIVSQLIIDDGVKGRGHRKNIFNPAFREVGIACGPHADFGTMCVMDFAGGFEPK